MNKKLISIAAANDFNLSEFKNYATKYQYRYGKIVGGFVQIKSSDSIPRLIKNFKHFNNPNRFLHSDDIDGLSLLCEKSYWIAERESIESGSIVWLCDRNLWSSDKGNHRIYATPNWDKDGEIPFDVVLDGDENGGEHILTLNIPEGMPLLQQQKLYFNILKSIIDTL